PDRRPLLVPGARGRVVVRLPLSRPDRAPPDALRARGSRRIAERGVRGPRPRLRGAVAPRRLRPLAPDRRARPEPEPGHRRREEPGRGEPGRPPGGALPGLAGGG